MNLLSVLLGSKELKRTIVSRCLKNNIPLQYVCKECGISYVEFMRSYINVINRPRLDIDEETFKKLLSVIGISIRYQVVIDSEMDMKKLSKDLLNKYEEKSR